MRALLLLRVHLLLFCFDDGRNPVLWTVFSEQWLLQLLYTHLIICLLMWMMMIQMPGLAFAIGKALALSSSLAAGLVLVACINGAQASNLCT